MEPDDLKETWQSQTANQKLSVDADLLLQEVRRNQQTFDATILARDFREVGVALILIPVWVVMGICLNLPWTWYLSIPALVWIAGFLVVDRRLHGRPPSTSPEPLRQSVEISLKEMDHQIWLLRNVFWWYLLPPMLSILAFFLQTAWKLRDRGWETVGVLAVLLSTLGIVMGGVYWINQFAVRKHLIPRRQELETLLTTLSDEAE